LFRRADENKLLGERRLPAQGLSSLVPATAWHPPMTVTTKSMRQFATDCLLWATELKDPSQRQLVVDAVRDWALLAAELDREAQESARTADIRSRLH
jgi:hypothetical protein